MKNKRKEQEVAHPLRSVVPMGDLDGEDFRGLAQIRCLQIVVHVLDLDAALLRTDAREMTQQKSLEFLRVFNRVGILEKMFGPGGSCKLHQSQFVHRRPGVVVVPAFLVSAGGKILAL